MKYTTLLSSIGIVCLAIAVLWWLPAELSLFINLPGLFLVIGGTLIATCVSRRRKHVISVLRQLPQLFRRRQSALNQQVEQFLGVAEVYRHGRIRLAEDLAGHIGDPFAESAVGMVLDRVENNEIGKILQWRINAIYATEQAKIQVVKTMATFAPAFGMLGTLIALVHMLYRLDGADLSHIGQSMAFAMITTLYGIVLANLICRPLAIKMEQALQQKLVVLNMWVEGISGLMARRHPVMIKETMDAFLMQNEQFEAEPALLAVAGH